MNLPPYKLLPSLIDPIRTKVYALEDGVLVYRGEIWRGEYRGWPGWFARPLGWPEGIIPDHFSKKTSAIARCMTAHIPPCGDACVGENEHCRKMGCLAKRGANG